MCVEVDNTLNKAQCQNLHPLQQDQAQTVRSNSSLYVWYIKCALLQMCIETYTAKTTKPKKKSNFPKQLTSDLTIKKLIKGRVENKTNPFATICATLFAIMNQSLQVSLLLTKTSNLTSKSAAYSVILKCDIILPNIITHTSSKTVNYQLTFSFFFILTCWSSFSSSCTVVQYELMMLISQEL